MSETLGQLQVSTDPVKALVMFTAADMYFVRIP